MLFRDYANQIYAERTLDSGSRVLIQARLVNHVYPVIGRATLRTLAKRPSAIQSLISNL
ncbi:hypothetical protein [Actinomadura rudentiformis]|uniref:hypothetical protein n=1 Tax=Actinomadura rudentiformis TaxID=359158 RepID=UPI00178C6FB8|nr:hypothetical protein [Actinomadura rudentiformis]